MKSIVRAIATAVIASAPALCLAQIVRVEMHPIQSVTMTDQDFLNGRKDAKPVTLAGQLKIPRAGSERLPAVVLLHGRQPFSYADPCVELGPTIAYNEQAHAAAQKAVQEFFAPTLLAP